MKEFLEIIKIISPELFCLIVLVILFIVYKKGINTKWIKILPAGEDRRLIIALQEKICNLQEEMNNGLKEAAGRDEVFFSHIKEYNDTLSRIEVRQNDLDQKLNQSIENNSKELRDGDLSFMRIELLLYIYNNPREVKTIHMIYSKYKALHGNSYMEDVYNAWREKYAKDYIEHSVLGDD